MARDLDKPKRKRNLPAIATEIRQDIEAADKARAALGRLHKRIEAATELTRRTRADARHDHPPR